MIELKITAANPAELRQQVLDMQSVFSVSLAAPQQQLEVATPAPVVVAPAFTAPEQTEDDGDAADVNTPDSRGFVWDARIHSSNQKRVKKDNTWQYKRGVSDAVIAQVEAEQKAPAAPAPEVVAPAPAAATVAPATGPTFPTVMNRFVAGTQKQLLDQIGTLNKLREIATMLGLPNAATFSFPELNKPENATVLVMFADYLTSVGC